MCNANVYRGEEGESKSSTGVTRVRRVPPLPPLPERAGGEAEEAGAADVSLLLVDGDNRGSSSSFLIMA